MESTLRECKSARKRSPIIY